MNIFEITLDVDKRANKESVNLRQGDINGTTIMATLRDHDVPMEGGSYTAMFCMLLPDRKTFYHDDATYENGVVTIVVKEQYAAAVAGTTNNAYFELYDGDELKYTTASFVVRVKPSAMDGEAAQSYDPRVEALMTEMRGLIDTETESETGRVTAEEGRVTAEEGRAAAEQVRVGTFTANEASRANTFATNEANRDETFTANEGRRAAAYSETEGARSRMFLDHEEERQTTFEENEAERASTFEENETKRQELFEAFSSPTVSIEQTATGQVAHITWKDADGVHVSDMSIDDAISVSMTGDTFSIPVDENGVCTRSGTARFYFAGYVGNRMSPCTATSTSAPNSLFTVRYTAATAREMGLVRIDYIEGRTYPTLTDVVTVSMSCGGRTFLHRIEAVAPRAGASVSARDYISHDSLTALCDALSGHLDVSIIETWNDEAGRYDYTIVSGD